MYTRKKLIALFSEDLASMGFAEVDLKSDGAMFYKVNYDDGYVIFVKVLYHAKKHIYDIRVSIEFFVDMDNELSARLVLEYGEGLSYSVDDLLSKQGKNEYDDFDDFVTLSVPICRELVYPILAEVCNKVSCWDAIKKMNLAFNTHDTISSKRFWAPLSIGRFEEAEELLSRYIQWVHGQISRLHEKIRSAKQRHPNDTFNTFVIRSHEEVLVKYQEELGQREELLQKLVGKRYDELAQIAEERKKFTEAIARQYLTQP